VVSLTVAIVWHYLHNAMFSRFDRNRSVTDGQTHTQTHRQTHDDGIYRASIASRGNNVVPGEDQFSNFGVSGIFAATGPQIDDRRSFGTLTYQNGLEYYNFDFSRLIGTHFCTSRRNVARFE